MTSVDREIPQSLLNVFSEIAKSDVTRQAKLESFHQNREEATRLSVKVSNILRNFGEIEKATVTVGSRVPRNFSSHLEQATYLQTPWVDVSVGEEEKKELSLREELEGKGISGWSVQLRANMEDKGRTRTVYVIKRDEVTNWEGERVENLDPVKDTLDFIDIALAEQYVPRADQWDMGPLKRISRIV